MSDENSSQRTQSMIKSLLLAAIWIFLAIAWTDSSVWFRYAAGAAGVAFLVEGLLKLRKR